jgi:hypothetical protein
MKSFFVFLAAFFFFSCAKQSEQIISKTSVADNAVTNTIQFSGYTWNVKNGAHLGPGPNYWSRNNVWVDANGFFI